MSEEILKKVKEILSAKVGEVVATSTIRVSCQKINISPKELTKDDLDIFAEEIRVSLLLFLNDKEVEEVIEKIKNI